MSPGVDLRDRPLGEVRLDGAVVDLRTGGATIDLRTKEAPRRTSAPDAAVVRLADHAALVAVGDAGAAERLADQWLTDTERAIAGQRGERGRPAHVAGRIAAKQAIAAHLDARGFATVAPERIEVTNDEHGCPRVRVRGARVAARHLRVSIAHSRAVALAVVSGRADATVGIDVEPIEPRSARFEQLTLTVAEQALAPIDDDRDTWLTRLWSAKEASAKATGRGLRGRPKGFETTAIDGNRLRVDGRWILTEVVTFGGVRHVVATTADHPTECTWHRS